MRSSIHIVDVDRTETWTRYRAGMCDSCQANCCTMPLEVRLPDLVRLGLVDPFEVEEVLAQHPSVAEAVVVGVPDPRTGEQRIKAVVVKSADEDADALIRYCRERLASQKVPAFVEFRDEIPKSAAGKPLRGRLMEGG